MEEFDNNLFKSIPDKETQDKFLLGSHTDALAPRGSVCPFYPRVCHKAYTSWCDSECLYNPDSYMEPEIKAVFTETPWAIYCFDCGDFVSSLRHEANLNPPELIESHTTAVGTIQYKLKLKEWTLKRLRN